MEITNEIGCTTQDFDELLLNLTAQYGIFIAYKLIDFLAEELKMWLCMSDIDDMMRVLLKDS